MKLRSFVVPALLLIAVAAGYAIGRFQGNRSFLIPESSSSAPGSTAMSMLGSRAAGLRPAEGEPVPDLGGNLGAREIIDALVAAGAAVSPANMNLAILKAGEESDPVRSSLMFAQLIQMMTPENAKAALEAFSDLPSSSLVESNRRLFRFAWGQIDGPAAAEFTAEIGGRSGRYAAYSVMAGWSSVDPEAAIAWVESIEEPNERESFYRGIVDGLAKTDPALATEFALKRHAEGDKEADDYISTIAREQYRVGVDTVTAWIDTLTVTELKQDAVYRVSREMVRQEPEKAAKWVEAYVGNEFAVSAIGEVADEWAEEDAPAAVAWVAGLPAGEAKTRAFGETFNEWTEDDPFAAAEYLVTMPNGPERDAAVTALSRRHVRDDPEAAVTWADSITDEAARNSALTYTGQQWMRRDPESAGAWLETSGLPEETRQKIENVSQGIQRIQFNGLEGEVRGFRGGGGRIDIRGAQGGVIIRE